MDEALRKARAAADRLEKLMESNGEVTKNDINRAVQAIRNLADKHEEEMNTHHVFC